MEQSLAASRGCALGSVADSLDSAPARNRPSGSETRKSAGREAADENSGNRHGHRNGCAPRAPACSSVGPTRARWQGRPQKPRRRPRYRRADGCPGNGPALYAHHVLHDGTEPEDPPTTAPLPPARRASQVETEADRREQRHHGQLLERAIDVDLNPSSRSSSVGKAKTSPATDRRR